MFDPCDPSNTSTVELIDRVAEHTRAPALSLVWVCAGQTGDVVRTLRQYLDVIERLELPCELIVVGNGLGYEAIHHVQEALQQMQLPSALVRINQPSAESAALRVGLGEARGEMIAVLPSLAHCDLRDLGAMLDALDEGLDYVSARRQQRVDSPLAQARSKLYNWLVRSVSGVPVCDINSGLRVMRREVAESVPIYGDLYLFLPILAARQGYRVGEVPVTHLETWKGGSARAMSNCMRRALDLFALFFLLRFTYRPFRFFGGIGASLFVTGSTITMVLGLQRIMGQALADRPMLVLAVLLMVFGIQLLSFGLLGELIIYAHSDELEKFHVERVYERRPG